MSLFLTIQELRELTGSARRTRQIEWLTKHGWKFELDFNDRPVVAKAEMQARMVSQEPGKPAATGIQWDRVA